MKVMNLKDCDLKSCIRAAQREKKIVITRNGKPLVVVVGVKGMDLEQVELGYSDKFWTMIAERRKQKTYTREELERMLEDPSK